MLVEWDMIVILLVLKKMLEKMVDLVVEEDLMLELLLKDIN